MAWLIPVLWGAHVEFCDCKVFKMQSIKSLSIGNGAIVNARMRSRT